MTIISNAITPRQRQDSGDADLVRSAVAKAPRRRWLEPVIVVVVGCVLAIAMSWPLVTRLDTHVADSLGDSLIFAWVLAWGGFAVAHPSVGLWDSNTFSGEPDTFAYTDTMLGYAPFGMVGHGTSDAILRYNIVFLVIAAMAFIGGYALLRQLGASWPAASFAGVVWCAAPWRLAHDSHLTILSTGAIALSLFALARGHGYSFTGGFDRAKVRAVWIYVGWALACWQVANGFAIGLPFLYVMAVVVVAVAIGWLVNRCPRIPLRAVAANMVGGAALIGVAYWMAQPYFRIDARYGAAEQWSEVEKFSPPLNGLVTAPTSNWLWGDATRTSQLYWPWEMAIHPGYLLIVLAGIGLFYSAWSKWIRAILGVAATLGTVLTLGTTAFNGAAYRVLWDYLPGWDALRTPGRLIIWVTLLLVVLAAGAVTKGGQYLARIRWRAGRRTALVLGVVLAMLPAGMALAEGWPARQYYRAPPVPATLHEAFREAPQPVLVLPSAQKPDEDLSEIANYIMLWSVDGFPDVVNGISSFSPPNQWRIYNAGLMFPDYWSVRELRAQGVRTVVVLRDYLSPAQYATVVNRPIAGLGIRKIERPDATVFLLTQRS